MANPSPRGAPGVALRPQSPRRSASPLVVRSSSFLPPLRLRTLPVNGRVSGYNMKPGYNWGGEYLVWSLAEMIKVDLHDDAKHYP
eukprot:4793640-Heterocapsa_arctica.AAC.1